MPINASVTNQQITASVGETQIDVSVSGGVGPTGSAGSNGAAATIAVGTVTTGAPGSSAAVVNAGSSSAAVLNFTIPAGAAGAKGDKGDQGDPGSTGATGAQGPAGVVTATAPVTYDAGTQTVGLSIGSGLTTSAGAIVVSYGSSAGTACQGNDARLSDARTPTAHNQAWSTITSTPTTLAGYGITDAAASSHTHAQLHDRSHAITSSSDHTATAWRVFYSNGSGVVTELALGASGKVLQSNGAAAAPTWETPAGGGSTSASDLTSGTLAEARLNHIPFHPFLTMGG